MAIVLTKEEEALRDHLMRKRTIIEPRKPYVWEDLTISKECRHEKHELECPKLDCVCWCHAEDK